MLNKKTPSYDVSAMETELKNKQGNSTQTSPPSITKQKEELDKNYVTIADNKKKGDANKLLRSLFESQWSGSNKASDIIAELTKYKERTIEILAMDIGLRSRTNTEHKYVFSLIDGAISRNNGEINRLEKASTEGAEVDEKQIQKNYYRMQMLLAYWNAAHSIFNQEVEFEKMHKKISDLVTKSGTVEQMKATIVKNNIEETKNRKLPAAIFNDANIEKQFIDAVNFSLAPSGKGTVIKVHILTDWVISRNEITSVIVGRSRRAAVAVKGTDGKCYLSLGVFLQQEYIGGSFQNPSVTDARLEGSGEMLCENIK